MTRKEMNRAMRRIPWGGAIPVEVLGQAWRKVTRQVDRAELPQGMKEARRKQLRREMGAIQ